MSALEMNSRRVYSSGSVWYCSRTHSLKDQLFLDIKFWTQLV